MQNICKYKIKLNIEMRDILKNLRKRCLKITEPYNLSTIDDFFERTHGSYM